MKKSKRKNVVENTAPAVKTKDASPKVYQKNKINYTLSIAERDDFTEKQKEYIEIITNKKTNIVFLKGPAGTSKSYLATYAGLKCLNNKTHSDILYIRAPIEVGKSIGHLPGELEEKINGYLSPLHDKLEELLPKPDIDYLIKDKRVNGTIPNFLRGQSWNARFIIIDESQNLDAISLKTIITRIGKYSKLIFLADESQADLKGSIEFMRYFDLFNDESSKNLGIYSLSFDRKDIVRSQILSYILDKIEGVYTPPEK